MPTLAGLDKILQPARPPSETAAAHHAAAAGGLVTPQAAGPGGFVPLQAGPLLPPALQADPRLAAWLYAQSQGIPAYGSGAGWNWAVNRSATM